MAFRRDQSYDARYGPRPRSRSPPTSYDRRHSGPVGNPAYGNPHRERDPPPPPQGPAYGGYNNEDSNDNYDRGPRPMSASRDRFDPRDRDAFDRRPSYRDRGGPPASRSSDPRDPYPPPNSSSFAPLRGTSAQRGGRFRGRGTFDDNRVRRPPPPAFDDRPSYRRAASPPPQPSRYSPRDGPQDEPDRRPDDRFRRDRDFSWNSRRDFDAGPPSRFDTRSSAEDLRTPISSQQQPASSSAISYTRARDDDSGRRASVAGTYNTNTHSRYDSSIPADQPLSARSDKKFERPARGESPPPQAPSVPAFGSLSFAPTPTITQPSHSPRPATPPSADSTHLEQAILEQNTKLLAPAPGLKPAPAPQEPHQSASTAKAPNMTPMPSSPPPLTLKTHVSTPHDVPPTTNTQFLPSVIDSEASSSKISPGPSPETYSTQQASAQDSATQLKADEVPIPTGPAALRKHPSARRSTNSPHCSPLADFSALATKNSNMIRSQSFSAQRTSSAEFLHHSHRMPEPDRSSLTGRASAEGDRPSASNIPTGRATPPISAPTGPRAHAVNVSPRAVPPTAPRAERMPPPGYRGAAPLRPTDAPYTSQVRLPHGPRALVWTNPKALAAARDSLVPMKRSSSGEARDSVSRPAVQPIFSENTERSQPISAATDLPPEIESRQNIKREGEPPRPPQPTPEQIENKIIEDRMDLDDFGDPVEPMLSDASSDDGMDLDEDDFEVTRAKFEKQRTQLESQIVDLSDRKVRATTPLALLAKLSMIRDSHLQKFRRPTPEPDGHQSTVATPTAMASAESVAAESVTPKEEDVEHPAAGREVILPRLAPRRRRSSADIRLPHLARSPISPRESIKENLEKQAGVEQAVVERMLELRRVDREHEEDLMDDYTEAYRRYALLAREIDDQRASRGEVDAQPANDFDITSADTGPLSAETPTTESSRRLHKFSSEYEMQRVLKESEETARVEQEKLEKASKKAKDDLEKEAEVPALFSREMVERRIFVNKNTWHDALYLTEVFGFHPPPDDFTVDEQRTFAVAFKERPKRWGEIAELLPGRTYQDCIHHYYANKWDGRFRETKGKRRSKMGRGRGGRVGRVRGAALMADLGRVEEDGPVADGASTASGRPKRAATNRTAQAEREKEKGKEKEKEKVKEKEKEKDREAEATKSAVNTTPNKKIAKLDGAEPVTDKEKAGKQRRKKDGGDKIPRKSKTQPSTALALSTESPPKAERSQDIVMEDVGPPRVEDSPSVGERSVPQSVGPFAQEHDTPGKPPTLSSEVSLERARGTQGAQGHRPAASSYWSVPEQQDFVKFISYFGTDFAAIAAHMGTKTTTMVKNYYQRSVDGGSYPDLEALAKAGNERRQRGEDVGPPPAPTQSVKRRYETPGGAGPQTVTTTENAAMAQTARVAAAKIALNATPSTQSQIGPLSAMQGIFDPTRAQLPHGEAMRAGVPGPLAGRFAETPMITKPESVRSVAAFDGGRVSSLAQPQSMQARSLHQLPIDAPSKTIDTRDGKSPWYQELSRDNVMQREHDSRGPVGQTSSMRDHPMPFPPSAPPGPVYSHQDRPMSAHGPGPPRGPFRDERLMTPAFLPGSRPGQGVLRHVLGGPNMSPIGPTQEQFAPRDPSPPKYASFRPSSVPAALANPPPPLAPSQKAESPKEAPRRSNLAALLNSEPEEPRRKHAAEQLPQPATRPHSPAQLPPRGPTPTQQPYMPSRHDPYEQNRGIFERPGPSAASPAPPYEGPGGRWNANPAGPRPRDDWPARHAAPPQSGAGPQSYPAAHSPNPMLFERERPAFYQRRPSVSHSSQLAQSPRTRSPVPTKHAQAAVGHSRTLSYGQSTPIEKAAAARPMYGYDSRDQQEPYPPPKTYPYSTVASSQTQQPRVQPFPQEDVAMREREKYEQDRVAYERERERERQYRAGQAASPYAYQGPAPAPQMVQNDMPPGQYPGQAEARRFRPDSISESSGGLREMAAREGMDVYMREQYARGQQMQQQQQRVEYDQRYQDYGRRPSTASSRKEIPPRAWDHDGQPMSAYPADDRERRQMLEANLRADGAIVPRTGHVNQPPAAMPPKMTFSGHVPRRR